MPEGKKTYKVDETVYDIPVDKEQTFLQKYPNAIALKSFIVDKDTFDIPDDKVEKFLQKYPNAKPTFEEKPLKKKDEPKQQSQNMQLPAYGKDLLQDPKSPTQPTSQQGTSQPQSYKDFTPPQERSYATTVAPTYVDITSPKAREANEKYALQVISEEISNLKVAPKQEQPFSLNRPEEQNESDGDFNMRMPKPASESLEIINQTVSSLYPDLKTTDVDENGNVVYTNALDEGITRLALNQKRIQAEKDAQTNSLIAETAGMSGMAKMGVQLMAGTTALAADIVSLVPQLLAAGMELTGSASNGAYSELMGISEGLRGYSEGQRNVQKAIKISSGISEKQIQQGATKTMMEDPINGLMLLGYDTIDAIPSMAAIVTAPEVSISRLGAVSLGRAGAAEASLASTMTSSVYRQALQSAAKTLGMRSNLGILALAGTEGRSGYEDAIESGLSDAEAVAIGTIKGASMYVMEHFFMGAEDMLRKSISEFGSEATKKTLRESLKKYSKELPDQFIKEGLLEEGIVNLVGQIVDAVATGKEFNVYSFIDESLIGGMMGVSMTTASTATDVASSAYSTYATNANIKRLSKAAKTIREQIESDETTKTDKDILVGELSRIEKELADKKQQLKETVSSYNDEDKKRYQEINQEILLNSDKYRKSENEIVKSAILETTRELVNERASLENKYKQDNQEVAKDEVTKDDTVTDAVSDTVTEGVKDEVFTTPKNDALTPTIAKNEPVNETVLSEAINEAYSELDRVQKNETINAEDKAIME